ncbi:hypothetical protein F4781DRAFT_395548 [Annulohypoxylon bovei var. microspora]|nr:hypothetical protein F4781DRAFT_395548 [Annulohypoxylon bovei var. microspora]
MEAERDSDSSTKGSTAAGDLTPTHTSDTEDLLPEYTYGFQSPTRKEIVPCAGNTYIIRDPISGRQITLERGELSLKHHTGEQGGFHWVCIENNGWLGFYDPVHGMYMGRDNRGGYIAKVKRHRGHEYFCARRHVDGGYLLLTQHWNLLMKMRIDKDGKTLVETNGEGTAWEFVKAKVGT